jgi:Asp-tRNA(Asn)/Glu-tRNA(Gln) amidotransferase A subunit family amidase
VTVSEPWQMTAAELSHALRARELSATEALMAVLERADYAQAWLNPFAVRLDERAYQAAKHADRLLHERRGGVLCGVPVTTKDSQWIAGVESTAGSRVLAGHVPEVTSTPIERLDASGAVVFATTTTPEFCYSGICESPMHGITANPWGADRTPGGSSGGAAAAVAARAGAVSLGGDGGGSIRIPSAFCGVVGFKPTFGAVPREPCGEAWKTLVSVGPLTRTVHDARICFETVAGHDPRDRHSISVPLYTPLLHPHELRLVATLDRGGSAPIDDDVRRLVTGVLAELESAGVQIVYDDPGLESGVRPWVVIAASEAWNEHADHFDETRELMAPATVEFLEFGSTITLADYQWAQRQRDQVNDAYVDLLRRHHATALVTPTLGCEAFESTRRYPAVIGGVPIALPWLDWAGFLPDANLAGLPACAVPVGLGGDQLPISTQILGVRGDDAAVLAVAELVEHAAAFVMRPPEPAPISG